MNRSRIGLAASLAFLGLVLCPPVRAKAEAPKEAPRKEEKRARAPVSRKQANAQRDALFARPVVLDISLTIGKDEVAALNRSPRQYVKATLKVGDQVYPNVGVHLKGAAGSWRGIDDKPGLTIKMNKFGQAALCRGMVKFHLSNSVQDPSYASELICGELFRAAGVPASRISHALVTINGRKRGLYYLKEGYDKLFLRNHFQNSDGNFYDGGFLRDIDQPLQRVRGKGVKDHSDLKALVAAAREPKAELRLQKLDKVLDLDRFLSFLVLESITWDWDGYPMKCNNYRVYHDTKRNRIVFIPSGMDQMFGHPGGPILPDFQGLVARAVLSTPEGQARYYARMAEAHADLFVPEKLSARLDAVLAAVQPALTSLDRNAGRDYANQIKRLQQAIAERSRSIDRQLKTKFGDRWILFQPPGEFAGGRELKLKGVRFFPEKRDGKGQGKFFWRHKGETKFASLPMEPAGANRFQVTLPPAVTKAPFEYYVEVSEGGKTAREPAQGEKAPRLATPDLAPPTAVPALTASAKSYRVTLGWKAATDDRGVAGYLVHRGAADGFELNAGSLLGKLPAGALAYIDTAPTPKRTAWYAVRAVDVVGRQGEARYLRVDVPDHQPPADTLTAQATGSLGAVLVSWSGEPEACVAAVEVFRGEGERGELKKIGEVTDLKKPHFLDREAKLGRQYRYRLRARSRAGLASDQGKVVTGTPVRYLKRINCGGPRIEGDDGVAWEADTGQGHQALKYSGSNVWTIGPNVKTDVFASERWANYGLGYELKVEPGRYEVVLLFAETNDHFAGKGKRLFDVLINDRKVAEKVDVFTEAGGKAKPWRLRKEVKVTGRALEIKLLANPVGPAIKGIEVRGLPAK